MSLFRQKHITGTFAALLISSSFFACSSQKNLQTNAPKAIQTEAGMQSWGHLDPKKDKVPGMSVNKAYSKVIKNKTGEQVIVAVLDSGVDLLHEDLSAVLWKNPGEIPGDGIDNDGNGYVDDVFGYNFLGESYHEQLEVTRILARGLGSAELRQKAEKRYEKDLTEASQRVQEIGMMAQMLQSADQMIKKTLGKDNYTQEDLGNIKAGDELSDMQLDFMRYVLALGENTDALLEQLKEGVDYYTARMDYHLNKSFDGRSVVGDNPYDISDRNYGNGNPQNRVKDESHGTHVAGIIAADRTNQKGIKGVAHNVAIMSIRAVPDGDEYDKDIALGIRYAVDNGAKIINASFGKPFSPNADWVYEAIAYAASKDVLIVHAAGNDALDLDDPDNSNFPNDHKGKNSPEFADNVLTVGALNPSLKSDMIASFSNYGKTNVDIFAPGNEIYSTMPENEYDFQGGTSMAAPAVAGLAALIRSYYPQLSAAEVKKIIMDAGYQPKGQVALGEEDPKLYTLDQISRSGKIANAHQAMKLARKVARRK